MMLVIFVLMLARQRGILVLRFREFGLAVHTLPLILVFADVIMPVRLTPQDFCNGASIRVFAHRRTCGVCVGTWGALRRPDVAGGIGVGLRDCIWV